MPDPIANLRALLAKATPGPYTRWNNEAHSGECTVHSPGHLSVKSGIKVFECDDDMGDRERAACTDAKMIVAAVNALPALLEVAEAAKEVERHQCDLTVPDYIEGESWKRLREALAKLEASHA